jgi:L-cysteine/cystine lyase
LPDLTHLQRIRQEMPATTSRMYLNTGTFGPMPSCVLQAMQERLQHEWSDGRIGTEAYESTRALYTKARSNIARLLDADMQEITLTNNTGEGMNIISYGFNWREGDEVITTNHEHTNALAPLYQIRDRYGIVIRVADLGPQGDRPALEAVSGLVTSRTRLIDISHVTWTTGAVLDVRSIGQMGREHGIPVLIDGAQSAGAIPVHVKDLKVDFYAIPMQKWLCGPDGSGGLYIRRESQHYVTPTYVGYKSVKHEEGVEWALEESAQCFDAGGRSPANLAGLVAALDWLEEFVGYKWLFERISSLHAYTCHALKSIPGLTLLTPIQGASGLVTFKLERANVEEVVTRLKGEHNIYIRSIPSIEALRISTGFYNTEEEIDTLVRALLDISATHKPL